MGIRGAMRYDEASDKLLEPGSPDKDFLAAMNDFLLTFYTHRFVHDHPSGSRSRACKH
jgi:hypothetical protein